MKPTPGELVRQLEDSTPSSEPAIATGVTTGTVAGLLGVILYFFPNALTGRQTDLILVVAAMLLPVITALLTRGKVWSFNSVKDVVEESVTRAVEKRNSLGARRHDPNPKAVENFDTP